MTIPPPPDMPGNPGMTSPGPGMAMPPPASSAPPPSAPPPASPPPAPPASTKGKQPLVIGIIAGVLALCLLGTCVVAAAVLFVAKTNSDLQSAVAGDSTSASSQTATPTRSSDEDLPPDDDPDFPPEDDPTTEPTPPPPPARNGQCIVVSEDGDFLGIGNCNGSRGTYRVVSVDYNQGQCDDPESAYITVDGYRLCLELHLVRHYCYKFPEGRGWVVGASKCKAKGTVHIIDIVPGASNGDQCTQDYQWNRWYRFTHPTVVYCVMQY